MRLSWWPEMQFWVHLYTNHSKEEVKLAVAAIARHAVCGCQVLCGILLVYVRTLGSYLRSSSVSSVMFCGIHLMYRLCVSCRHCVSLCVHVTWIMSVYMLWPPAPVLSTYCVYLRALLPCWNAASPVQGFHSVHCVDGSMEIWLFFCLSLLTIWQLRRQEARG